MSWIIRLDISRHNCDDLFHTDYYQFHIESSQPLEQVVDMYKTGVRLLNFDIENYASDYSRMVIEEKELNALKRHGLIEYLAKHIGKFAHTQDENFQNYKDKRLCLEPASYLCIWLFIAEYGDDCKNAQGSWEWSLPKHEVTSHNIGGDAF